jgi:hypothetical protein
MAQTFQHRRKNSPHTLLLFCGVLASVLYLAMNIIVPLYDPGYNSAAQTISELSAVDAPTTSLWIPLGTIYTVLVAAFGRGVWLSAGTNKALRVAGIFLFISGAVGIFWGLAPMHQRQVLAAGGGTFSDTMHIVFSFVTVALMLFTIGLTAAALDKWFRFYSIVTMAILLLFGILTGVEAPKMEANLSTPNIGILERICIGAFMLWMIVFATVLLKREQKRVAKDIKFSDMVPVSAEPETRLSGIAD